MSGPDCENGRWLLQSHDVCCVWSGVLLAVHERNKRFALSEVFVTIKLFKFT